MPLASAAGLRLNLRLEPSDVDGKGERVSIFEIPRVDRGAIWSRAEELQRLHPEIEDSRAIAMAMAMNYYLAGSIAKTDRAITEVARDRPGAMFRIPANRR
jgi:hypothetical protein